MGKELSAQQIENIADAIMNKMGDKPQPGCPVSRMTLVCPFGPTFESGQIFEAKTMKGNTNYVTLLFQTNDWVYWCHGDKAKKTEKRKFVDLIEGGDLHPIDRKKADPQRVALSVLGLNAMAQGLNFNDYLKVIWDEGDGSKAY